MKKENIRAMMYARIKGFSQEELFKKSLSIKDRLLERKEFSEAETVMIYVSKNPEVDTLGIISYLLDKKKSVVVPYVEDDKIKLSMVDNLDCLEKGNYGISEPKKDHVIPVEPSELDLIIVPGVAFDMDGNRLGKGKGFYDRFLSIIRQVQHVLTIALAYDFQIMDKVPSDSHDEPLDMIITEKMTITAA